MVAAARDIELAARERRARLADEITELCGYLYAATYRLLVLIREFDEADGWHGHGLVSCAHWLNFKCGIGLNAAREKVRVAHALKSLPAISAAFERGALSYSKVRAMTRVADAGNEDYLLRIARHGTAHHMEKLVRLTRRVKRLQDLEEANLAHRERYLEHHYDADGCLVVSARLPAEQGALLVKALDKALERQFREPATTADVTAVTPDAGREPLAARRADAVAELAERYLASEPVSSTGGDRYQVLLHVTAVTPEDPDGGDAYLEDGPHVTAETSRRLSCDCSLVPVVEDENGEPLSIGRKSRSIPPAIRRALKLRDKGCRFPGCTNDRYTDGHHVKHWADGGETSLDNLVTLCRHHHRLVHEGGYGCERTPEGNFVFTTPDHRLLPDAVRLRPVDDDPYDWFEQQLRDVEIGPRSCTGDITDLRIDWDLALAPLLPTRH